MPLWITAPKRGSLLDKPAVLAQVHESSTLLHPRQGAYKLPAFPGILWNVQQTTIRNAHGDMVDVIG